MSFLVWAGVVLLLVILWRWVHRDNRRKREAELYGPKVGTEVVETVLPGAVNGVIAERRAAGWSVVGQSSTDAFLKAPKVSLRFRRTEARVPPGANAAS